MRYEGRIFRPPSEGRSYILQATIGCKHNTCAFCDMYYEKNYRARPVQDVIEDLNMAKGKGYNPERVFIADGDALAMDSADLCEVLSKIDSTFDRCKRVGIYATAKDVIAKGVDALTEFRKLGLGIIYLGLESGDDEVLKKMNKADLTEDMIQAARLVKQSGIKLSVTVISGLGGIERTKEHAIKTGEVLSKMDPEYVGLLTLMLSPNTPISKWIDSGKFVLLTPEEILLETKLLIENMDVSNCAFRSNHASNYINLSAQLPFDKKSVLGQIENAFKAKTYKPEGHRQL